MDGTAVTERLAHPELRERLDAADLEALRGRVDDSLHRQGVTFGPRRFEVDPVPRVIEADEWRELAPSDAVSEPIFVPTTDELHAGQSVIVEISCS